MSSCRTRHCFYALTVLPLNLEALLNIFCNRALPRSRRSSTTSHRPLPLELNQHRDLCNHRLTGNSPCHFDTAVSNLPVQTLSAVLPLCSPSPLPEPHRLSSATGSCIRLHSHDTSDADTVRLRLAPPLSSPGFMSTSHSDVAAYRFSAVANVVAILTSPLALLPLPSLPTAHTLTIISRAPLAVRSAFRRCPTFCCIRQHATLSDVHLTYLTYRSTSAPFATVVARKLNIDMLQTLDDAPTAGPHRCGTHPSSSYVSEYSSLS